MKASTTSTNNKVQATHHDSLDSSARVINVESKYSDTWRESIQIRMKNTRKTNETIKKHQREATTENLTTVTHDGKSEIN